MKLLSFDISKTNIKNTKISIPYKLKLLKSAYGGLSYTLVQFQKEHLITNSDRFRTLLIP